MQSLIESRGIIETGNETVARYMLPLIQEEITRAERVNLNLALLLLPALEKQWSRRECRKWPGAEKFARSSSQDLAAVALGGNGLGRALYSPHSQLYVRALPLHKREKRRQRRKRNLFAGRTRRKRYRGGITIWGTHFAKKGNGIRIFQYDSTIHTYKFWTRWGTLQKKKLKDILSWHTKTVWEY